MFALTELLLYANNRYILLSLHVTVLSIAVEMTCACFTSFHFNSNPSVSICILICRAAHVISFLWFSVSPT